MTTRALVLLLLPIAALTLGCPSREAPREPAPVEEAARGDAAGAQIATPRSPNPAADAEQTPTGRPAGAAQTGAPGASPDRPDVAPPPPAPKVAHRYAEALITYLRERVASEARHADDTRKSIELAVGQLRRFRRLAQEAYAAREYRLFTSLDGQLTEDGKLAAELLVDVVSHGLEPSPYPVRALRTALQEYEAALLALDAATVSAADGSTSLAKLVAIMATFQVPVGEPYADTKLRLEVALLAKGLHDGEPVAEQVSELVQWNRGLVRARRPLNQALRAIDVAVVAGFFQYALDFRFLKVAHPFEAHSATDLARGPRLYRTALAKEILAAGDELGKAMRSWWPNHPYYEKARRALAYYRDLVDSERVPGWKVRGTVKRGSKGNRVLLLKARLHAEGYYDGDLEVAEFDEALEEAVKVYQEHHQLKPDGIVRNHGGLAGLTRRSLDVPMTARLRQIRLSLQRWRESPVGGDPFYFRVNVPQFEVEVWEGDELLRTHRIIVGNNRFEIDQQQGRKGHLNRTALISNQIQTVVLNPVWHVPERIRVAEIMVEVEKDPTYLERHGYRVRELPNGTQQIYQEAGPGNALGRVKLLFPNRHSIYMHDTPKRRLFRRTIRAFSHGCMRLENPIDMAAFLLERQGIMARAEVDRALATGKERGLRLREKVPIHIEYNTIAFRADSDRPIFLNDVYKYDQAYRDGEVPTEREVKIPIVQAETPVPLTQDDFAPGSDEAAPAPAPAERPTPHPPGREPTPPAPTEGPPPPAESPVAPEPAARM